MSPSANALLVARLPNPKFVLAAAAVAPVPPFATDM